MFATYNTLVSDHYTTLGESLKRHVLLSETTNVTHLLPADIAQQGFRIYEDQEQLAQQQQQPQPTGIIFLSSAFQVLTSCLRLGSQPVGPILRNFAAFYGWRTSSTSSKHGPSTYK